MKGMISSIVVTSLALVTIYACKSDEEATSRFSASNNHLEWPTSTLPTWTPDPNRTPLAFATFVHKPTATLEHSSSATPYPSTLSGPANINIRTGPGTEYPVMQLLVENRTYKIIGESSDDLWWQIIIGSDPRTDKTGWVYKDLVSSENVESVPTALVSIVLTPVPNQQNKQESTLVGYTDINVRGGPGTNYPVLGIVSIGHEYTITGRDPPGDWWQISYNGQKGWVFSNLVAASNTENVQVALVIPTPPAVSVSSTRPQVHPEELKEWRVDELSLRIRDNELEFENNFRGKNLRVRGEVLRVSIQMSDTEVWIDLGGVNRGRGLPAVTCRMPIERRSKAMQIATGEIIVVSGIGGEIFVTFDIEDCSIIST